MSPILDVNLGNVQLLQGQEVEVDKYLAALQKLGQPRLYNNLGLIYFQAGDSEQAMKAFQQAVDGGELGLAANLGLVFSKRRASKAQMGGDEPGQVLERDLQALLMKSMKKRKKVDPKRGQPRNRFTRALRTGGRRGTPPDIQRRLIDLLIWPQTEK